MTSLKVVRSLGFSSLHRISTQSVKKTHVFRLVHQPERTPEGKKQRPPHERIEFQKLELLEIESDKPVDPLDVILLQDVEGLGLQFDIVKVDRSLARHNLIPMKKAVYTSPFNLQYYKKQKEDMKEELAKRVRIPYEFLKLGRTLMQKVVPILVSLDNTWTVDKSIVALSLLQAGINATQDSIYLPKIPLKGPNLDYEAKIIRFYISVNYQYVIPMLGRLIHISSDDTKKNLFPDSVRIPTSEQLRKVGLRPENPFFFKQPFDPASVDVFELMSSRDEDAEVYEV